MGNSSGKGSQRPLESQVVIIQKYQDLARMLDQTMDRLVVLQLYDARNPPLEIDHEIDKLSGRLKPSRVAFFRMDISDKEDAVTEFHIESVPVFVFYNRGTRAEDYRGSDFNQVLALVNKYK